MEKEIRIEGEPKGNQNVDYSFFYFKLRDNLADLYNGSQRVNGEPFGSVVKVIRFLSFINGTTRVGVNRCKEKEPQELCLADVWNPPVRPKKSLDAYKLSVGRQMGVDGIIDLDKTRIEIFDDIFKQIHEANVAEMLSLIDHHVMTQKDSYQALAFNAIMYECNVNLRDLLSGINARIPLFEDYYIDELEVGFLKDQIAERIRSI